MVVKGARGWVPVALFYSKNFQIVLCILMLTYRVYQIRERSQIYSNTPIVFVERLRRIEVMTYPTTPRLVPDVVMHDLWQISQVFANGRVTNVPEVVQCGNEFAESCY